MKNMEKRQVLNLKSRSPIEQFMGKNGDIVTPNFLKITALKHNKSEKVHRECSEQPLHISAQNALYAIQIGGRGKFEVAVKTFL